MLSTMLQKRAVSVSIHFLLCFYVMYQLITRFANSVTDALPFLQPHVQRDLQYQFEDKIT